MRLPAQPFSITPVIDLLSEHNRDRNRAVCDEDQIGRAPLMLTNAYGVGDESTLLVYFVDPFLDTPLFTYGFELDPTFVLLPGKMPTFSAHIVSWQYDISGPGGGSSGAWSLLPATTRRIYTGATVAVVTTGGPGKVWFHYSFRGRAVPFYNSPSSASVLPNPS